MSTEVLTSLWVYHKGADVPALYRGRVQREERGGAVTIRVASAQVYKWGYNTKVLAAKQAKEQVSWRAVDDFVLEGLVEGRPMTPGQTLLIRFSDRTRVYIPD